MARPMDAERRRVHAFISRLATLTEPEWGIVLSNRISEDGADRLEAVETVLTTIGIAGASGATAALNEIRVQVEAQIDLLASDAGFRDTVRAIGGENVPVTLARLAKDAAVGLLVKGVGDFELERPYSPRRAASVLYRPFEPVVPMSEVE
jgi:hypothetical protein